MSTLRLPFVVACFLSLASGAAECHSPAWVETRGDASDEITAAGSEVALGDRTIVPLADPWAGLEELEPPIGDPWRSPQERGPRGGQGDGLVYKTRITPHWFHQNTRFWYRNDLPHGAREFIVVDAPRPARAGRRSTTRSWPPPCRRAPAEKS